MDLMQEHHIRELKDKSQRRDEDFDGDFFQKVVSQNVRWFTRARSLVNKAVDLDNRTTSHGRAKRAGTANRLKSSLSSEQAHTFVPGRSYGWIARDDLIAGQRTMPQKIDNFIRRTTRDNPQDTETSGAEEGPPEEQEDPEGSFNVPAPSMVIAGQFIPGDIPDDLPVDEELAASIEEWLSD
jgi:hypothetical protein